MTNEKQLARINDWLAEHEPDAYHDGQDTATTVVQVLERLRVRLTDREHDLAYEFARANAVEAKVERLRAELAFDATLAEADSAALEALSAENDRLRAELERREREDV